MRPPGKAILRHTWLEPLGPNVERNYDHLIFLSSLSTSRSMSRFTNVLLFDCLDLVEFPSCHPVTHEQLFAGTGNCIQSPFQSCSIASLAWLGTRPPCPLHSSRICYLALCYRDDTHTRSSGEKSQRLLDFHSTCLRPETYRACLPPKNLPHLRPQTYTAFASDLRPTAPASQLKPTAPHTSDLPHLPQT